MRTLSCFVLLCIAFAAGCGGDDVSVTAPKPDSGSADATSDSSTGGGDAGGDAGSPDADAASSDSASDAGGAG